MAVLIRFLRLRDEAKRRALPYPCREIAADALELRFEIKLECCDLRLVVKAVRHSIGALRLAPCPEQVFGKQE